MSTVPPTSVVPPLVPPGQVVIMTIPQLHAYMTHHHLEPFAWRNNVLVLQKIVEIPMPVVEEEKEPV